MHGCGVMSWPGGAHYEGQWHHSKRHGRGVLTESSDTSQHGVYDGEWQEDLRHGHGVWRAGPELSSGGHGAQGLGDVLVAFEGSWHSGHKHGAGLATYADGSSYEGEYLQGLPHGHGRVRWHDGTELAGEWVEGEQCGASNVVFANGTQYDAEYCELLYSQKRSHAERAQRASATRCEHNALLAEALAKMAA